MAPRIDSDEYYVIGLCDEVLGLKASRQHTFDFLRGDGMPGKKLPVDAYYPELNLVVEYRERQHSESVAFFDKKTTVSGVSRSEQRRIYDQRRRDILPKHGIWLVEISYADLKHNSRKRLIRDRQGDLIVIRKLFQVGEFDKSCSEHATTTAQKEKSHIVKNGTQTWIYRTAHKKFGCLMPIVVGGLTMLLVGFLSICVFHFTPGLCVILPFVVSIIVGAIYEHYTTRVDERLEAERNKNRQNHYAYNNLGIPPVCCPVCGSLNIGLIDDGVYGCADCGLKWQQTY